MCFLVFLWSESATTLRQDWTNTCVLEPCKNDASDREERKSPNSGKRSAKRSVRVYAANCDCVTCLSKGGITYGLQLLSWPGPELVNVTVALPETPPPKKKKAEKDRTTRPRYLKASPSCAFNNTTLLPNQLICKNQGSYFQHSY